MYKLHNKAYISKGFFKLIFLSIVQPVSIYTASAQIHTGEVNYESLEIRFVIPEGWKGQETGEGFLTGHDTEPGMIVLATHCYKSPEPIKQEAQYGFQDQNGTILQLVEDIEPVNGSYQTDQAPQCY